jgi:hypothetical protein
MRRRLKAECAAVNFDCIAIDGGSLTDQVTRPGAAKAGPLPDDLIPRRRNS